MAIEQFPGLRNSPYQLRDFANPLAGFGIASGEVIAP
jgi:hypothetical protein